MNRSNATLLACAVLLAAAPGCRGPVLDDREWPALDGAVTARAEVYARTPGDAARALDEIRESVTGIEASLLSGRDSGSLGLLNRLAREEFHATEDRDLYRCVLLALDYGRASQGAFDPTVGALLELYDRAAASGRVPTPLEIEAVLPAVGWQKVAVADEARAIRFRAPGMRLDLGGLAKGLALDVAARAFARPGCLGGLLTLGGNAYAWGEAPGGESWSVRLPDPRDPGRPLLTVRATNRGVAVAGQVAPLLPPPERAARVVLDPATGFPAATDLIAAVGLADSGADADALSTALYVAGSTRGVELLRKMRQVEAVLIVEGDRDGPYVLASASLRGRLELSETLAGETGGRVRYLLPPGGD